MTNYEQVNDSTQFSRRTFLKMLGIGGAGVAIGASGVGSMWSFKSMFNTPEDPEKDAYEFYGKVQSGITTPTQKTCNFVALDLKSKDRDAIKAMFKKWTVMADRMMDGDTVGKPSNNPLMPPVDTGESIGLGASKLTITFGISKSLMKKIGLSSKIPDAFKDLPHFPNDQLIDDYSDGDIMIQACSNDSQVSFHAVHNLVRPFRDIVKVRWAQSGFISAKGKETPIILERVINLKIMCLLMTDGRNMELIVLSDVFKYTLKRGIVLHWKNKRLHLVASDIVVHR